MWNQRRITPCSANRQKQNQEPEGRAVIAQAAAELQRSSYAAIRQVRCDFRDGVLTLSGRVPSYYQMQVAQTLVQFRLPGVAIRNELRVLIHRSYESAMVCDEEPAVV
jgi:hypothetical protein